MTQQMGGRSAAIDPADPTWPDSTKTTDPVLVPLAAEDAAWLDGIAMKGRGDRPWALALAVDIARSVLTSAEKIDAVRCASAGFSVGEYDVKIEARRQG